MGSTSKMSFCEYLQVRMQSSQYYVIDEYRIHTLLSSRTQMMEYQKLNSKILLYYSEGGCNGGELENVFFFPIKINWHWAGSLKSSIL